MGINMLCRLFDTINAKPWPEKQAISSCMGAVSTLIDRFKKIELACAKLKAKQLQMGTPQHMLVQVVSTLSNSTFLMIARILEQRWTITGMMSYPTVRGESTIVTSRLSNRTS